MSKRKAKDLGQRLLDNPEVQSLLMELVLNLLKETVACLKPKEMDKAKMAEAVRQAGEDMDKQA